MSIEATFAFGVPRPSSWLTRSLSKDSCCIATLKVSLVIRCTNEDAQSVCHSTHDWSFAIAHFFQFPSAKSHVQCHLCDINKKDVYHNFVNPTFHGELLIKLFFDMNVTSNFVAKSQSIASPCLVSNIWAGREHAIACDAPSAPPTLSTDARIW